MRNLIICCDGTWNTPENTDDGVLAPTNVFKFFGALNNDERIQKTYYHPGVGTEGGVVRRLVGGGFGIGLSDNIKSAYKWLAVEYRSGDRIIMIGFSRGAYTVRSLAGMIGACGLLDLSSKSMKESTKWSRVEKIFKNYRNPPKTRNPLKNLKLHNTKKNEPGAKTTPIHFLGVWDTVGSLGIPNDLGLLNLLDNVKDHSFHDTELSSNVQCARHAVAIDEWRHAFQPTLWTKITRDRNVQEMWFAGAHSDVGGGYKETELSNIALRWMINEAAEEGVSFRSGVLDQIPSDNSLGLLHNSVSGIYKALKTVPRNVPCVGETQQTKLFHPTVLQRAEAPPITQPHYWPTIRLENVGDRLTVDVFAIEKWNATNLFVKRGEKYKFSAKGEWVDSSIKADPDGTSDGNFQLSEIVHVGANVLGLAEQAFQRLTGNKQADFWFTRRIEKYDWFSLVGYIANDVSPKDDESGEYVGIGKGGNISAKRDGYLYCFANDAWQTYGNNKGSVEVTIERLN